MKLRIRSEATKETIRIDIPNSSSFHDLKTLICSNISSTVPIPPESIHLSLNCADEIVSSPDEALHSLGLTSGDLLFYSLDSNLNFDLIRSPDSPLETLVSQSPVSQHTTDNMQVDSESESTLKSTSVPCFLRRVMEEEKGKMKGNIELTMIAIHAVFLETGFISVVSAGGISLPEGSDSAAHLISVTYTLPDLINRANSVDAKNVIVKFSTLGDHVSVYGCLVGARLDVYHLSLNSSMLNPILASDMNEQSEEEHDGVFLFWKNVKDRLSMPLLIDICQMNGLALPPCFTRLPTDIKIMILEFLPGIDIAMAACSCSELRYLASNDQLWKRKFLEEFKLLVPDSSGGWKGNFARSWVKRTRLRMDRENALVPCVHFPRIMIPGARRFPMIRGYYHRFPAIGDFGLLRGAGFNQNPARRNFSPGCDLGEGDDF